MNPAAFWKSLAATFDASACVGRKVLAVAREDVTDLSLRDRHERHPVDSILERREQVESAAKDVGLKPSLAVERQEPVLHRALGRDELLDDADACVGNVTNPAEEQRDAERDGRGSEHELNRMSEQKI